MEDGRYSALERMGARLCASVEKWMPDPLIFALLLTLVTYLLVIVVMKPYTVMDAGTMVKWLLVDVWYKGFWGLLSFAMQMCLILVTGYAIAYHPIVYRILKKIATLPSDTKSAAALTALIAMIAAWINWGLGLIVGAILARTIGIEFYRTGKPLHYPAVVAAGYAGLGLTWHWGLSASAPLLINTPNHFLKDVFVELFGRETVPLNETIFHPYTLINLAIIISFGVLAYYALAPNRGELKGIDKVAPHIIELVKKEKEEELKEKSKERVTIADKLENSKVLALLISILGIITMGYWFYEKGFFGGLNLNSLNFTFIMVGLLLYMNPIAYMRAITRAAGAVAGILIQFPFYAGIMGMMRYSAVVAGGPNLATVIANSIASVATPFTWPAICLYIAGLINIFIPSGGGEWAAVGEILARTSAALGVPIGKTVIAYGVGDAWTNLFQPFWAIPLLGLTGTRARDVFGYTISVMILATIPLSLGLVLVPY
ncbi:MULTISPECIES: TIGR00366 family protein [Archaeoglobus]|jgi:short-chain fatty acids transporter|uniref:Short chain fatty acids transporter n=2 Tax=Archaeoglobus fulgidus TaxID=2234 RepID=A0A075WHG6_ARCFL|nr:MULTISPECIES: TIGR00366 family protein [Archaeoglobus]AIG98549.1 hypothetical protein AFULGI_00017920 [Archaeoglobus fulgidus DSM 8774]KUJ94194.1 MAG: hypothetical protein XD40_0566 [Archaeoglobus fulgidus]KUK06705.1 MAG: hypothetical protein XD48_1035 [Archaeoglobus fulgidus]MDI3496805.1 short-chain fatty acid transporter [Archaeoglobus sp.]